MLVQLCMRRANGVTGSPTMKCKGNLHSICMKVSSDRIKCRHNGYKHHCGRCFLRMIYKIERCIKMCEYV